MSTNENSTTEPQAMPGCLERSVVPRCAYIGIAIGALLFVTAQMLGQKCALLQIVASGLYNGGLGIMIGCRWSKRHNAEPSHSDRTTT